MSKDNIYDFKNNNTEAQKTINEMEQIQKGLEAFLQQELRNMQEENQRKEEGPQLFDLQEEEAEDRELQIIGSMENKDDRSVSDMGSGKRRASREEYFEDWDSPEHSRQVAAKRKTVSDSTGRGAPAKKGSKANVNKRKGVIEGRKEGKANKNKQTVNKAGEGLKKTKAKKRLKKSKLKRFLITVLVLIVLLAAGLYLMVGNVYDKMNYEPIEALAEEPMQDEGVVNILLIGSDARGEESGRSDAMILISISNQTKKIYMTSLLRDMYVEIPGYKNNRLNAAYSFGGAELLMDTVEQNFDIDVNRYVLVNFEAFANLVDAVGGIDLELTSEEIEYVNGYLVEYNILYGRAEGTDYMDTSVSGMVHLNGPQALAYTRNRYLGTDFGRTERQRKVLEAIIKKAPTALLTNSNELIDGLMPNLTTNLTREECYQLSLMASKVLTYDIVQSSIPQEGTYSNATIRNMSVLEVDFEANKQYLRENIYGEGTQEVSTEE